MNGNNTESLYKEQNDIVSLIRPFFTIVFWIVIKISLAFIRVLFVDNDPIFAIINSIYAFLAQVVIVYDIHTMIETT